MDAEVEQRWRKLAEENWAKTPTRTRKVRPDLVKTEIWEVLEREQFRFKALVTLESLQLLENYLWPGYTEDATNHHVLLIAMMVIAKRREGLPIWGIFSDHAINFSSLFRRVLSLSIDDSLSMTLRSLVLDFMIAAFQSLDNGLVRKECAPLVSISIWSHLWTDKVREARLEEHQPLQKAWRASNRRFEAADEQAKARLAFDRSWLHSMIVAFAKCLYSEPDSSAISAYCQRFLEFLIDLESQIPTRRYVNALVKDMNLLAVTKLSPIYQHESNGLVRDLFQLLHHFVHFTINDHTGAEISASEAYAIHAARLARLQRQALHAFKEKLTLLALSNYGAIERREELEGHLSALSNSELKELAHALGHRTEYPASTSIPDSGELVREIIVSNYERVQTYRESIQNMSVLPTERDLYAPLLLRNDSYDGSHSLALPRLNLQYLTVGDFLWRSFTLYRYESFFEIRSEMEEIVPRMQPRAGLNKGETHFAGFSKMALPIGKPSVLDAAPPQVGMIAPAFIRAEVNLDMSKVNESLRHEWESLRAGDVVYLLAVRPPAANGHLTNGNADAQAVDRPFDSLRTAEVVQVLDDNGKPLRDHGRHTGTGEGPRPRARRLILNLDTASYKSDEKAREQGKDVYDSVNLLVRRKGRENNFKRILDSIKSLVMTDVVLPDWLKDVFLGFGDPTSASFAHLANQIQRLDLRDTFVDWHHLVESFPGKVLEPDELLDSSFGPPYVLETVRDTSASTPPPKRRKRGGGDPDRVKEDHVKVSTYKAPNTGPYREDEPKKNVVRFTPTQVEAIGSGTQPGLTVVVGPPGTGKTDVATQIVSNIYHDFPDQRTLLIAHSNQALNQLFQKITQLDIDGRHLLRLGHGEEELETESSYGRQGRVESFLDNERSLLKEVDRLAANLGAPGAHGSSAETAGYFKTVYIDPAWKRYWANVDSSSSHKETLISGFPFYQYFSNAPQPIFPEHAKEQQLRDIASGCQVHIERLFKELEDIRPFEIIRGAKERSNYLLIKEARVIAMTSTHAAMRRQEIADTGFHYDNVIMEEAAQITEIENFIPFTLQHPKNGRSRLQRVVLCGDHLQNSPVIQNLAFRQYANLEQSMFLRFVRLGVPTVHLDQQGRARPTIAELYKWRYERLGDLPLVVDRPEMKHANAGFRYDYQFINVDDYKGAGERQPSPHFIQNVGEAEYAVAIFMYMRLLGYAASKISILTTYAGQRALIRDVLAHRCANNKLFGLPRIVTTVDKYQGEQNDYVILSLVRSQRIGYLRDVRRLTVALSRARLGLYILGRQELFESCYELKPAFDILLRRPTSLMVVPSEVVPTTRAVDAEVSATEMTGVEHLGQYVYEMTQAKIEQLRAGDIQQIREEPDDEAIDEEDEDAEQPQELET